MELDRVHLPLRLATKEITRICKELDRYNAQLFFKSEDTDEFSATLTDIPTDDIELLTVVKQLLRDRRQRECFFPNASFADPQWDILLDLFVEQLLGRKVNVSSACVGAHVPHTTALRHITCLVDTGHIECAESDFDARIRYVALTENTNVAMRSYLNQVSMTRP
jgi:hypothetical protein